VAHRFCLQVAEFQSKLHVIYLLNDVLFNCHKEQVVSGIFAAFAMLFKA
jgi:hypothetical protein